MIATFRFERRMQAESNASIPDKRQKPAKKSAIPAFLDSLGS
jgi:hypothetical protein